MENSTSPFGGFGNRQQKLCFVCKKELLIIYPDHPHVHSTCVTEWKKLEAEAKKNGIPLLPTALDPAPSSPKSDASTLDSSLSPTKPVIPVSFSPSGRVLCSLCAKEIYLEFPAHPTFHAACFDRWKQGERPKPPAASPSSVKTQPYPTKPQPTKPPPSFHPSPVFAVADIPLDPVLRILASKSYYDIFEAPKTATIDELKSKFKQLALSVHPDRNSHPKSTEAFKKVVQAWECLNDPERRKQYDAVGRDEMSSEMEARTVIIVERWKMELMVELFNSLSSWVFGTLPFPK